MTDAKKGKVIVTCSRNIMALVIARSLDAKGVKVIGADCIGFTLLSHSKHCTAHEVYQNFDDDEDKFIRDLIKIIKKHKPDDPGTPFLLMPVFQETSVIIKYKKQLEEFIQIACPSKESIDKVFPKHIFAETAMKYNVAIPETFLPETIDEAATIAEEQGFPLLIKPYDDSGGRGIAKVENPEELKESFAENQKTYDKPSLMQKLWDGRDYCFTALYKNGEIKASMAYKNLHQFPEKSGSGVMRETVDDNIFIEEANKLLGPLKWNGTAQIDFMWDGNRESKPCVIEVNPRFWAGLFHSVQSGIDYPWLNYLLFSGQEIPDVGKPILGKKTKLPFAWLLSVLEESVNVEESLQEIKEAGSEAIEEFKNNHDFVEALKTFSQSIDSEKYKPIDVTGFLAKVQEARNAENEIFSKEDPGAAIGMLYALFYFAKFKKLPPEIGI